MLERAALAMGKLDLVGLQEVAHLDRLMAASPSLNALRVLEHQSSKSSLAVLFDAKVLEFVDAVGSEISPGRPVMLALFRHEGDAVLVVNLHAPHPEDDESHTLAVASKIQSVLSHMVDWLARRQRFTGEVPVIAMGDWNDHGGADFWRGFPLFGRCSVPALSRLVVGAPGRPPLTCCDNRPWLRRVGARTSRGDYVVASGFSFLRDNDTLEDHEALSSDHLPAFAMLRPIREASTREDEKRWGSSRRRPAMSCAGGCRPSAFSG